MVWGIPPYERRGGCLTPRLGLAGSGYVAKGASAGVCAVARIRSIDRIDGRITGAGTA